MKNEITCQKNHSGNTHLTRSRGGYECDGCGQHYREFVVVSQYGMTPFSTESTPTAARKSSRAARMMGLSGNIVLR